MTKIKIITSTNRSVGKGRIIANWIESIVKEDANFEVEILDLNEINLPFMNEPHHPMAQNYQFEHTKQWSRKIDEADAFIIVLGEYNYGFPAPIKNALDYLFKEWQYKPVGLVSYGGISGGLRATQMLKPVLTTLGMMPLTQQVTLPFFSRDIDENDLFQANESVVRSAHTMLTEIKKWSKSLKNIRLQEKDKV